MKRIVLMHLAALLPVAAIAAELGTAAEAKAMLDRTVAEVKKDKAAATAKINKGGDKAFKDKDLYPFCAGMDGKTTIHPTMVGDNLKARKDKNGKAFGEEIFKVAEEGKVKQVSYMWPKPDGKDPVEKITYVTKVGDLVCGVGYYK